MAEIGRQPRKHPRKIAAFTIPASKAKHGHRVPQIVNAKRKTDRYFGLAPNNMQSAAIPIDIIEAKLQNFSSAESVGAHQQELRVVSTPDWRCRVNCSQHPFDQWPRQGPRRLINRSPHRRNDRQREVVPYTPGGMEKSPHTGPDSARESW